MAARMLRILLVLQLVSVLVPSDCHRKKEVRRGIPPYHLHSESTLPADVQITTFLSKNESKRLYYASKIDGGALSATLIACTSTVLWSFEPNKSTNPHTTEVMETYHSPRVIKGLYTLDMLALDGDTYVHIYLSTEPGGPQTLRSAENANLRLIKRQKKKRLTVKWNPSLVDPGYTDYCLVVSTREFHGSLCSIKKDPMVVCVGHRTHHTLANLTQGQKYYYSVFATNNQTNFTYPYGATSAVYDGKFKPTTLKDGKAAFADLKKLDGKAVFRYKTWKNTSKALEIFVVPCGGAVDVEVTLKDSPVIRPRRIEGFKRITVEEPLKSVRYYIKVFAENKEELKKMTGVEVYVTTRSLAKIPLPDMPQTVKLQEYKRTCNSVTVGWMAPPTQKKVRYCVTAKEGNLRDLEDYRIPNQCGLESRLRKSKDFTVRYCMDVKVEEQKVIMRQVKQLKPGRSYIVQVTVKKSKGKTLSYDLLHVFTKPCKASSMFPSKPVV